VKLIGELFEVDAANQFHRDVIDPVRFAEMIRLDNVGVDQVGDEFSLADEILDELFLVRVVLADDFDRQPFHEAARAMLLRFVNDPHAALVDLADDLVANVTVNGEECRHRFFDVRQMGGQVKLPLKRRRVRLAENPLFSRIFLLAAQL
jgi:hypothetical protein